MTAWDIRQLQGFLFPLGFSKIEVEIQRKRGGYPVGFLTRKEKEKNLKNPAAAAVLDKYSPMLPRTRR